MHRTLAHAEANTDFYTSFWNGAKAADFDDLSDLQRFPVLRKGDIAADPSRLVSRVDPPDSIRDTSGTTGVRLPIYVSDREEIELAKLRAARSLGQPRPRMVLRILPPPRRLKPLASPAASGTQHVVMHVLPFDDLRNWWDSADFLLSVLSERYAVEGGRASIDVAHCTPPPLFAYLTRQIVERGIDPGRLGLSEVLLTGGPLSDPARNEISSLWNAQVTSTFSCTEIRGEAFPCSLHPERFHISQSAYVETLDETDRPVDDGECGELTLTGFHPYQRVMPIIRYQTGDYARRHVGPCACGDPSDGFEVLGRSRHVLRTRNACGRKGPVLGTTSILHAIEGFRQIPTFPFPRFQMGYDKDANILVRVEAADPRAFDAAGIETAIRADLLTRCPDFRLWLEHERQDLLVRLVPKNALTTYSALYPGR